jgi:peptidoglycan/LPS O-acetylase OafA/YrhL
LQVPFGLTIGGSLFALSAACFLGAIHFHPNSILVRWLALPPLVWTGRISYGLYLWHFPVFTFVGGWFPDLPAAQSAALKIFATFLCATISYYGLERPCLKLKTKFSVIKTPVPTSPSPVESVG